MRKNVVVGAVLLVLSSAAQATNSGYLFVSSEKDNNVTVLDGKTYEVVKRIGTAARPRHLQFSPDRSQIYVAAGDGNAIDVIDVATLELVDRIAPIDDPELFDLSSDGKTLFITLEDDAKLGFLDLAVYFAQRGEKPDLTVAEAGAADDAESVEEDEEGRDGDEEDGAAAEGSTGLPGLSTLTVGAEPEGILANPNGQAVYVTSEVANMVHVVDPVNRDIKANIVVGNRPRRFVLTPDGKELWVTSELAGSVSIIATATNQIIDTIEFLPKGFRPEEVTPVGITLTNDGKTAIIGLGRANHVVFVNVAERKIEDYVLVGSRAWNTTLNRDETLLYVVNGLSDDISVIDMASRKVIKSIPVGRVPHTVLIDD